MTMIMIVDAGEAEREIFNCISACYIIIDCIFAAVIISTYPPSLAVFACRSFFQSPVHATEPLCASEHNY